MLEKYLKDHLKEHESFELEEAKDVKTTSSTDLDVLTVAVTPPDKEEIPTLDYQEKER